jgi:hypothetical protein
MGFMMRVIKYFIVFLLIPQLSWACSKCFGANVNTATTQGIGFAMLGLLGITGFVSTGIVMFFWNMKKRSRILFNESGSLDPNESNRTMNQFLGNPK